MADLTLSVDDAVLQQARLRALQENTTVAAVLGQYLEDYARIDSVRQRQQEALKRLLELADANPIDRGERQWNRDELYER